MRPSRLVICVIAFGLLLAGACTSGTASGSPNGVGRADLAGASEAVASVPTLAPPTETPRPSPTLTPTPRSAQPPASQTQSGCHPAYSGGRDRATGGCIRANVGDYDCWPGSGDGPNFVSGPVKVLVRGVDPFNLDRDGDGWACE
jgi:hypothetical protein